MISCDSEQKKRWDFPIDEIFPFPTKCISFSCAGFPFSLMWMSVCVQFSFLCWLAFFYITTIYTIVVQLVKNLRGFRLSWENTQTKWNFGLWHQKNNCVEKSHFSWWPICFWIWRHEEVSRDFYFCSKFIGSTVNEETQINFRIATLLTWRIFCFKLYLTPHEKPYAYSFKLVLCTHLLWT